ncbi:MAG: alpha/beta hydrolase [Bifidobacteriaceae bacterium]|nr:alpha/beta hydrolase [Bifidobacteriaceae bacterium]
MTANYLVPGYCVADRTLKAPFDWTEESGGSIDLFFREIVDPSRRDDDLPLLLYLQGGPGGKGIRPMPKTDWLPEAIKHYRVIMPDQRGTGRSTPVDGHVIGAMPPEAAAEFLGHLLAGSIVRDFELIRRQCYGGQRWFTLGQSYGGFLTFVYLSQFPEALRGCYVTGGIPGIPPSADDVYRRTYPRARAKTEQYYRRYPQDVAAVNAIADRLADGDVQLPNGDPFTVRRLQSLGLDLGTKPGFERLHWLVEEAFAAPGRLSPGFAHNVLARTSSANDPLFWPLQEFIYGSDDNGPMDWAAHRALRGRPEFDPTARPLMFTSEMALPWMFDEVSELKPFKPAVEMLMERVNWPTLYDPEALAANGVPLQALIYADDLYVDSGLQLQTLATVGNSHAWVTNEYEHDGIHNPPVFAKLYELMAERGGGLR